MQSLPLGARGKRVMRGAVCAALLSFLALLPGLTNAQSLDTGFLGRVVDSSGAVVPAASVTITSQTTGTTHATQTDQPQNLTFGYVYQLPGRELKGFLGGLLGGWQTGGIVTLASGFPFDVLESFDSENNGNNWERPNLVPGQSLTIANPGPSLWFNPNAFTSAGYSYGNSPRDPLFGPGTHTFNLSLMKNFRMPFREQQLLQFRMEFFNAFNTPQFANPNSSLGNVTFGQVSSTKLDNREIQFAFKYIF